MKTYAMCVCVLLRSVTCTHIEHRDQVQAQVLVCGSVCVQKLVAVAPGEVWRYFVVLNSSTPTVIIKLYHSSRTLALHRRESK